MLITVAERSAYSSAKSSALSLFVSVTDMSTTAELSRAFIFILLSNFDRDQSIFRLSKVLCLIALELITFAKSFAEFASSKFSTELVTSFVLALYSLKPAKFRPK